MIRNFLPLGVLALLSACSKPDGELNPGNWKSTVKIDFEVPGAPLEKQAMIKQQVAMMMGDGRSSETCMTPEQAKEGVRAFFERGQPGACKLDSFTRGNGKMNGVIKCSGSPMGSGQIKMNGTYDADNVNMTTSAEISRPEFAAGKAIININLLSERTGDCKK